LQPPGQARDLDGEYLLAALAQLLLAARHERVRLDVAAQPFRRTLAAEGEADGGELLAALAVEPAGAVAVGPRPVQPPAFEVDVRDSERRLRLQPLRLGQHACTLGDQAMAAEDHVGGRFAGTAAGIDVRSDAAARLILHQLKAVLHLAD